MRIRQLVRKINKSLGENPKEWQYSNYSTSESLENSRGITITRNCIFPELADIGLYDKWTGENVCFFLNDKEIELIQPTLNKLLSPIHKKQKIEQEKNKNRRGWLAKEILKSL